jgi:integrase
LETGGGAERPDGSMRVADYWQQVFYPVLSHRIARQSQLGYESCWRRHISPAIGNQQLRHVTTHALSAMLDRMADAGLGKPSIERAAVLVSQIFEDATESGYIDRAPSHRLTLPLCRPAGATRPLDESEARRLIQGTSGRTRLFWRVLLLTAARPGEVLALQRGDIAGGCIRIERTCLNGKAGPTKNKKSRICPIPESLDTELREYLQGVEGENVFPSARGKMLSRDSQAMRELLAESRAASGIADLTFRRCRTTFATEWSGDAKDAQEMLGHARVDTTMQFYRRAQVARQRAAVEEWDARLSGRVVTMHGKAQAG